MNTLELDQVKSLGAQYEKAEVHVSLRNKTVKLVLLIPGRKGNHPALDFLLDGDEDWQQVGTELTFAASNNGLLQANRIVAIMYFDSEPVHYAAYSMSACTGPKMMWVTLKADDV